MEIKDTFFVKRKGLFNWELMFPWAHANIAIASFWTESGAMEVCKGPNWLAQYTSVGGDSNS